MSFMSSLFNVFLWCIVIACIIQCCCRYRARRDSPPAVRAADDAAYTTTTITTTVYPPGTAPPPSDDVPPDLLRSSVLKAMFPEQKIENDSTMIYDPESNSYQWTNNTTGDASCSICLENFEPGDVVISSSCSHCYHRDCIMGWLEIKDECPNCRQPMWEPETYDMIADEVRGMEREKRKNSTGTTVTANV